ncbi:MAG: MucR family transcriptional regulator [Hyphomicrobiaceae bacterium]|nr:MucR family transcriptional regulator [Hyphomicrobiaceae bacterium]MCC0023154.1 MucR family transcriptional regulator [Hyphomicrobiaceae bacterium]
MTEEHATKGRSDSELIDLSTEIVCAYVANNEISPADVTKFLGDVHTTLKALSAGQSTEPAPELKPAVPVRKSIGSDYIVCLEDGKKFKSLKRHLRTHYDLSPEEYREKWNLPADYPMVAPSYSEVRSSLAKANGLGRKAK